MTNTNLVTRAVKIKHHHGTQIHEPYTGARGYKPMNQHVTSVVIGQKQGRVGIQRKPLVVFE